MKPFQRLKVVLCFFIFISMVPIGSHAFSNSIDTLIPPSLNTYSQTGYRLSITSIKVDKSNGKSAKIVYNLSNGSRNPLKLGKGRNIPKQLVFEFDESLNSSGMLDYANAIATALSNQKVTLRPGQLMMNNKLKVDLKQRNPDLVIQTHPLNDTQIAEIPSTENTPKNDSEEITETIVEEGIPTEIPETVVVKTEIEEEIEAETKESMVTKMPPLENTESIILNTNKPTDNLPEIEEVEIIKVEKEIVVEQEEPVEENEVIETKEIETEEVVTEVKDEIEEIKEVVTETEMEKEVSVEEVLQPIANEEEEKEEEEIIAEDAPHYEVDLDAVVKDKDFLEEDICADLVMESVKIIKQSGKSVTLEYVVANYGNGSAALFGESKKDDDNVAIKAHLSKSRKLTRGSIPLKGTFINKGIKNKSGMLLPKERMTNTMKIDVSKMTKFTPVLVLSLDGFQDVEECDEFNNTVFINLIEVNKVAYAKPTRPKQEEKVLSKINKEDQ